MTKREKEWAKLLLKRTHDQNEGRKLLKDFLERFVLGEDINRKMNKASYARAANMLKPMPPHVNGLKSYLMSEMARLFRVCDKHRKRQFNAHLWANGCGPYEGLVFLISRREEREINGKEN